VKRIAFDKTGTLTQGVFQLLHFETIVTTTTTTTTTRRRSRKEVLGILALVEAPASHPLSDAIVRGAAKEQVDVPSTKQVTNHTLLPGEGITAVVDGTDVVHVGNTKLFKRLGLYGLLSDDDRAMVEGWAFRDGGTTGFVSIGGEGIVGAYSVADKIRDEAKGVVHTLRATMGIEVTMLTGDQRPAALGIGNQIGLDHEDIKSELLPEDKMTAISNMVVEEEEKTTNNNNTRWNCCCIFKSCCVVFSSLVVVVVGAPS